MKKLIFVLALLPVGAILLAQTIAFPGAAGGPSIGSIGGVGNGSGSGITNIPSVLGVVTNTTGGVIGVTVAIPTNWLNDVQGFMNAISNNAVSGLPSRTNYYQATNSVAGNALVIVGPDANGQFYAKGTNWPSGGSTPSGLVTNSAATDVVVTNAGVNTTITSNSVTTGTGTYTLGSVSLIPTNAAVVLTAVGVAPSMPFGITNSLSGRAQPVVQYYFIDAVTGVPILTFSNEASGVKFRVSAGALANVETNFCLLPITSTNTIWRARDESTGSGASVGILTNWFIGL